MLVVGGGVPDIGDDVGQLSGNTPPPLQPIMICTFLLGGF